jgi:hypothetical protein
VSGLKTSWPHPKASAASGRLSQTSFLRAFGGLFVELQRFLATRRLLLFAWLLLPVWGNQTPAQTATNSSAAELTKQSPSRTDSANDKTWSFSAQVYGYLVPESRDYVQPTFNSDYGWLHLEAKYNYESLETGSVWVGYNFSGGEKLAWELTPMLGGVFGNTAGIAPGFKGSLIWWKLELYSEGEFVVDTRDSSQSYFYDWSELALSPVHWFRFGLVTERTRAYKTDRELQRGFLVGFLYKQVSFTTYIFNPDDSKPTIVLAVGLNF